MVRKRELLQNHFPTPSPLTLEMNIKGFKTNATSMILSNSACPILLYVFGNSICSLENKNNFLGDKCHSVSKKKLLREYVDIILLTFKEKKNTLLNLEIFIVLQTNPNK